jgi:hypothetical protein
MGQSSGRPRVRRVRKYLLFSHAERGPGNGKLFLKEANKMMREFKIDEITLYNTLDFLRELQRKITFNEEIKPDDLSDGLSRTIKDLELMPEEIGVRGDYDE